MPKFHVTGVVTGSKFLGTFEADTEEEAITMALESEEAYVTLCHQCSSECEDAEIHDAVASKERDAT
jgi:hypothetical protein